MLNRSLPNVIFKYQNISCRRKLHCVQSAKIYIKVFLIISFIFLGSNQCFSKNNTNIDSISDEIDQDIDKIKDEIDALKAWNRAQKELSSVTNKRIEDNLSHSSQILSIAEKYGTTFTYIIAGVNLILVIWVFMVGRDLKSATRKINEETKIINHETKESNRDLNRRADELYKEMLNSRFGQYNKDLRDKVVENEKHITFEDLPNGAKLARADQELENDNIRDSIRHYKQLLTKANKEEKAQINNRLGIAYHRIGASVKSEENFEKAYLSSNKHKRTNILNLLSQRIILGHIEKVEELIKECNEIGLEDNRLPVLLTLRFVFYVKFNMKDKLRQLQEQQNEINWKQDSNWNFNHFKDYFQKEYANDFYLLYEYANIIVNKKLEKK